MEKNIKFQILKSLKEAGDLSVSGEKLSNSLGVSRTAIWKHINELKKEGYEIEASSKKGYVLVNSPDIISKEEILQNINTQYMGHELHCFDTIDSTNTFAKQLALKGCRDGTCIVADTQTSGRGRLGRSWFSPSGKGVWMSVVLRPEFHPEHVQFLTLVASVAVAEAIETFYKQNMMQDAGIFRSSDEEASDGYKSGLNIGIKWPNDIIINGRKVCGILTELSAEMERINYIVLGIGINVNHTIEDFPEEIKAVAGSIAMLACKDSCKLVRAPLVRLILESLEKYYDIWYKQGKQDVIVEACRRYSVNIGRRVRFIYKDSELTGTAIDIDDNGRLVVNCDDGSMREIVSGEVSVRGE